MDNFQNEKAYNMVIKRCCAFIREEMKGQRDFYKRLIPLLDKVIATNPLVKEEDVAQEQYEARQRLWDNLFKEYINKLELLLKTLNKKDDPTHS